MASKVDLAWAAGIIDADGCVTLHGSSGTAKGFRRPGIAVDNTDGEILAELVRLFGGSLVKKKRTKEHHRQCWSWRLYGADKIISFLSSLRPYMRNNFKRERARMIVEEYKAVTPRNGSYTDRLRAQKEAFVDRFMNLGAGRGHRAGK